MDIVRLYQDYSISHVTEGHKHARPGWANVECPWCTGNPGYHLGYDMYGNYYFCWRCGWHSIIPTIARLLKINEQAARVLVKQYGLLLSKYKEEKVIPANKIEFATPSNTVPLRIEHKEYLHSRGYDPDRLESMWGLKSTSPTSKLDNIDYKNRILIPFVWSGEIVSFDTRSVSKKETYDKRYKACPKAREIVPHKQIVYGRQEEWLETGICVEGPTDVWRIGTLSFATSGVQFTTEQLRIIARTFKRVIIWYDNDDAGIKQGKRLSIELRDRGVDTQIILTDNDPGSTPQDEANYIIKQIL